MIKKDLVSRSVALLFAGASLSLLNTGAFADTTVTWQPYNNYTLCKSEKMHNNQLYFCLAATTDYPAPDLLVNGVGADPSNVLSCMLYSRYTDFPNRKDPFFPGIVITGATWKQDLGSPWCYDEKNPVTHTLYDGTIETRYRVYRFPGYSGGASVISPYFGKY